MEKEIINPIDKDKVTDKPGLIEYAHHVGSAIIKPSKESDIRNKALMAMEEQTQLQLDQIRQQIDLLAKQAQQIINRREVSFKIYQAKIRFKPLIGEVYFLYFNDEGYVLSMIHPDEWGKSKPPGKYDSTVKLLADHTWVVLDIFSH